MMPFLPERTKWGVTETRLQFASGLISVLSLRITAVELDLWRLSDHIPGQMMGVLYEKLVFCPVCCLCPKEVAFSAQNGCKVALQVVKAWSTDASMVFSTIWALRHLQIGRKRAAKMPTLTGGPTMNDVRLKQWLVCFACPWWNYNPVEIEWMGICGLAFIQVMDMATRLCF